MKRRMKITFTLAILVAASSMANAEIVSNSKIVDDIEYYMQVDDSVYELGEDVEMLYRVTNLLEEEKHFGFGVSPENNFWIEKDGENIRTVVEGWWMMPTGFTLLPDESKEYTWIWDMRDDWEQYGGVLVEPGVYDIIGGFDAMAEEWYEYSKVSVSITVVPEPCSMILLGFGALVSRMC